MPHQSLWAHCSTCGSGPNLTLQSASKEGLSCRRMLSTGDLLKLFSGFEDYYGYLSDQ